eukprot:scaffold40805_cov73-Attheya_sp.AAC.3
MPPQHQRDLVRQGLILILPQYKVTGWGIDSYLDTRGGLPPAPVGNGSSPDTIMHDCIRIYTYPSSQHVTIYYHHPEYISIVKSSPLAYANIS